MVTRKTRKTDPWEDWMGKLTISREDPDTYMGE